MSAANVLFAALFAAGAFTIFVSLLIRGDKPTLEVAGLGGSGEVRRGFFDQLQFLLDTARLHVTASEFLLVSLALAVLGGLGALLVSAAPLAGLLGFLAGGAAYWFYLKGKADRALEEYENALPQVLARLVSGARAGGTFVDAVRYVIDFGPENCREDWQWIYDQMGGGGDLARVFDHIVQKRGSLVLASIFELILIQQERGAPLSKTLEAMERSFRERVRVMRQARVSMKGPLKELWIVCSIPFFAVVALRFLAPGYAAIYSTLAGQLILLLGWGVVMLAFILGYRSFSSGLREETNFGALDPEKRPAPPEEAMLEARALARRPGPGDDEPTLLRAEAAPTSLTELLD